MCCVVLGNVLLQLVKYKWAINPSYNLNNNKCALNLNLMHSYLLYRLFVLLEVNSNKNVWGFMTTESAKYQNRRFVRLKI